MSRGSTCPTSLTLIDIIERLPKAEWRQRYIDATGQTERQFRRNRDRAAQVLACRRAETERPDVHLIVPKPPKPPLIVPPTADSPKTGHADVQNALRDRLDIPPRFRGWIDPENN